MQKCGKPHIFHVYCYYNYTGVYILFDNTIDCAKNVIKIRHLN